jgi:hypothetical protein
MFATIGAVLASDEFKLTASGEEKRRKSAGKPRARNSDIRRPHAQTCPEVLRPSFRVGPTCTCHKRQRRKLPQEERAARRLYRATHPRYWALRTIVGLLMAFAEDAGQFSPALAADRIGCNKRTVQRYLGALTGRRCFKHIDRLGGRGHHLTVELDRTRLLAFAQRLKLQPTVQWWQATLQPRRPTVESWQALLDQRQAGAAPPDTDANRGLCSDAIRRLFPDRKGDNSLAYV